MVISLLITINPRAHGGAYWTLVFGATTVHFFIQELGHAALKKRSFDFQNQSRFHDWLWTLDTCVRVAALFVCVLFSIRELGWMALLDAFLLILYNASFHFGLLRAFAKYESVLRVEEQRRQQQQPAAAPSESESRAPSVA